MDENFSFLKIVQGDNLTYQYVFDRSNIWKNLSLLLLF